MVELEQLRTRIDEQAQRVWDRAAIAAWLKGVAEGGIAPKTLDRKELVASKEHVLERVQKRAEECTYLSGIWGKGAALPVMEEFGLGSFAMIKALSPSPGLAGTGRTCGAVIGGLMVLGLYFGSDDLLNREGNRAATAAGRLFLERFEQSLGSLQCRDIQTLLLGRYFDSKGGKENTEAFAKAKGLEKCTIAGGVGARLAAEVIIESMERGGTGK